MEPPLPAQPNVHQVREQLADYLAAAERGEEVLIRRRNQPVARLVPVAPALPAAPRAPRPLGLAPDAGQSLPAAFFDPLPDAFPDPLMQPPGPPPGAGSAAAADPGTPDPAPR
jgi:prevent-host-death family protein